MRLTTTVLATLACTQAINLKTTANVNAGFGFLGDAFDAIDDGLDAIGNELGDLGGDLLGSIGDLGDTLAGLGDLALDGLEDGLDDIDFLAGID